MHDYDWLRSGTTVLGLVQHRVPLFMSSYIRLSAVLVRCWDLQTFDVGDVENAASAKHSGKAGRIFPYLVNVAMGRLLNGLSCGLGRVPDIVSNRILGDSASWSMSTPPRLCVGISMGGLI